MEDGSILRVSEQEVLDCGLYAGKELSEEEAQKLLDGASRSEWKEKTIRLLMGKPQSRRETERKLEQWGADEESAAVICDRMEELGFLDDVRYAKQVVKHYSAKGFGERKLRDELYRRGIPREFWQEVLEDCRENGDSLDRFIEKKLSGKPLDRANLKKVSDALARRGFSWSEINEAMRRFGARVDAAGEEMDDIF